jgi:hypothetical protein
MSLFKVIPFFFFGSTGSWSQCFTSARLVLYYSCYSASSFCIGCFWDRFSFFAWVAWTMILLFVVGIYYHKAQIILVKRNLANFLPGLASNFYPVNFCLPSSWDYRLEPLCPARLLLFDAQKHNYIIYVLILYPSTLLIHLLALADSLWSLWAFI